MSASFNGRTALVTGAGRGIGRAVAVALSDAGANLVLLARSKDQLASTADEVSARGHSAVAVVADLSDATQLKQIGRDVLEASGGIDILVNNAATVAPLGATTEIATEDFLSTLILNVVAVTALTKALVPPMLERGWGRVVNVSSGLAVRPTSMPGGNTYVTSKAALEAHTANLAAEVAGSGVTVNIYRPGTVDTTMQSWIREQDPQRIGEELHRQFVAAHERGSLISPERSAAALLQHLAGRETGQVWTVDSAPAAEAVRPK
ncbi:SDR family NAD(P)-dependent oxidoreductase [Streptomyces sp. NPDC058108]|uniref:SDR family NAD(P)-dependent oxidoreductase n=1 Tax=Streptomyces sp. NPDC058108 TaxID=3346344 RepID=UPI0036EF814B